MPNSIPTSKKTADQLRQEFYAGLNREAEERQKSAAEFDRRMQAIEDQWGGFSNAEGESLEDDAILVIGRLQTLGGMRVVDMSPNLQKQRGEMQYDGLLECKGGVVLVEVKHRVRVSDVRKFVEKQMPGFRRDFPGMINGGKFYGAVAGLVVNAAARKLAEKEGLFVLKVGSKRRVKVLTDSTPAFRPRAY